MSLKDNPVVGLIGGILFTLVLVMVVPLICNELISGIVDDLVRESDIANILNISSMAICNLLMWIVLIGFTILLGGGTILKKFGIFGIIGLIVAYFLLGNPEGAIMPILTLVLILMIMKWIEWYKGRNKNKEGELKSKKGVKR